MTLNAHRLVAKSYEIGGSAVQIALITLIFRAYVEEDLDINDHQVLADAAEESGLMSKAEVSVSLAVGYWESSVVIFWRKDAVFQSGREHR